MSHASAVPTSCANFLAALITAGATRQAAQIRLIKLERHEKEAEEIR